MSLSIYNLITENSYHFLKTSESKSSDKNAKQVADDNKDTRKSSKEKQATVIREGNFYCTYELDDNGQKILVNKVPIGQEQKAKSLDKSDAVSGIKLPNYNAILTTRTAFEYNKQLHVKSGTQDIMDFLKTNIGIKSDSNS